MFDWEREAISCTPEYYKWSEWFFKKFYENEVAYRGSALVNWSETLQTVLANEQVIDGKDERTGQPVVHKMMEQWFFAITKYADELLNFEPLDWPESIKIMQTNWIGRSEGARATFRTAIDGHPIEIYTTRPDTLWGATFMVLAPEHGLVEKITTDDQRAAVEAYVAQTALETEIERLVEDREKTGVFTGAYVINPVNGEEIQIWIADYVMITYGTGAIMAVPAHDQRDFEFARAHNLPIRVVIQPQTGGGTVKRRCNDRSLRWSRCDGQLRCDGWQHQQLCQRAIEPGDQSRHRLARGKRQGRGSGQLPLARLADQPAALLGQPDSDDVRGRECRSGSGR